MKLIFRSFILAISLCACSAKSKKLAITFNIEGGIFRTYKPGIIDRVRIENRLSGHIFPLPVTMIYFRKDGVYVMGFCDNQVYETGRYLQLNDSIRLFDRHIIEDKTKVVGDQTMFFDSNDTVFYYTMVDQEIKSKRHPNKLIPLKKDCAYAHYGFLRGQEISLDSLLNYYQLHSVDEQNKWSDSVYTSLNQHN